MTSTFVPPPLPPASQRGRPASALGILLSLIVLFFLACGVVSLASDTLTLFFGRKDFAVTSALALSLMMLMGVVTYVLLAFRPGVPKRFFLPICLYVPVMSVASLPLLIYFTAHAELIGFALSLVQVLLAVFIVRRLQANERTRWPFVSGDTLAARPFRWSHFLGVLLAGALIVLPAILFTGAFSARLAVAHFTDGFVDLGPAGITMQVRKYVRDDGRKITLVPMVHVGQSKFYQDLAASFPDDGVVLMEGVTDKTQALPERLNYSQAANAVGGVQQIDVFHPKGHIVSADVDLSAFSPETLQVLKMIELFHSKGLTPETISIFTKPMPPDVEQKLFTDILTKRNQHLLEVIEERLSGPDPIIVPWGAAHLPGIAQEIQKLGFHLVEKQDFVAISFGSKM